MEPTTFAEKLANWVRGWSAPEEQDELLGGLREEDSRQAWLTAIDDLLRDRSRHGLANPECMRAVLARILAEDPGSGMAKSKESEAMPMRPGRMGRRIRRYWSVSAAVVLLVVAGMVVWRKYPFRRGPETPIARQKRNPTPPVSGSDSALLTLSDGQIIPLGGTAETSRVLATDGNSQILVKDSAVLEYKPTAGTDKGLGRAESAAAGAKTAYNVLATPRGGQYRLILPDGSRVWLNDASRIRYPVAFTDSVRRVEISGEAYIEVARDPRRPFIVHVAAIPGSAGTTAGADILDLGTSFDVNTYADDPALTTTLLEGRLRLSVGGKAAVTDLRPGQQAVVKVRGPVRVATLKDPEEAVAWKEGWFDFKGTSMEDIMRQLARWYDLDVHFEKTIGGHYVGRISRQAALKDVLHMLEEAAAVRFEQEGRRVTVIR